MEQLLPMGKLPQEKHTLWKEKGEWILQFEESFQEW